MSTELLRSELKRLLRTDNPEILCIRGRWGIGKTFLWQTTLEAAKANKECVLERYSYVSAFGLTMLADLRTSIVENVELLSDPSDPAAVVRRTAGRLVQGAAAIGAAAAEITGFGGLANVIKEVGPLFFAVVRNQIICFDDLERTIIPISTILGLASFLKEQRSCKVVIILNDEAFQSDASEEWQRYFEKVIDLDFHFAPTANDSVRIALHDLKQSKSVAIVETSCEHLGIANIRVIRRIYRMIEQLLPLLKGATPETVKQSIQTVCLFAWAKYEPDIAPSEEFLLKRRGRYDYLFRKQKGEELPPSEVAWNALLDEYGFGATDELDLLLWEGIKLGYFDPTAIRPKVAELDMQHRASRKSGSIEKSWRAFHQSFDDNTGEVLKNIEDGFRSGIQEVNLLTLDGTIGIVKALGEEVKAGELLEFFMKNKKANPQFWDVDSQAFPEPLKDPDVIKAVSERYEEVRQTSRQSPGEVLLKLGKQNGWGQEDAEILKELTENDFVKLFHEYRGSDLLTVVSAALQFERIAGVGELLEVSRRARSALVKIKGESRLNEIRVKKFGL
jgi:hypothetical protein